MADRSVEVKLTANVSSYLRSMAEAKAATRDLANTANTTTTDVDRGFSKATASVKDMGTAGERLARDVEKNTTTWRGLASGVDSTRLSYHNLIDEFNKTGNRDLITRIIGEKRELSRFTGFAKELDLIPGQASRVGLQAGGAFSGGFLSAAASILAAGSPVLVPTIGSFLAAAVAGAALGTIGGGAIAVGLASQFSNPLVHSAAVDLGDYLKTQLAFASSSFADRFVSGFHVLEQRTGPFFADLSRGFAALDPYVSNLFVRLAEGLNALGPGLSRALASAGPILGTIAKNIPTLLNAINIFFDEISKGGKGATEAIDAIVKGISTMIAGFGFALRAGADMYDFLVQAADKLWSTLARAAEILAPISPAAAAVAGPLRSLATYTHGVATAFDESKLSSENAAGGFTDLGSTAEIAANKLATLNQQIDDYMGKTLSAQQANLAVAKGWQDLSATLAQNGHAFDANTAAGNANQEALLGQIGKLQQARDAAIAQAGGVNASASAVAAANAEYDAGVAHLADLMRQAGFTTGQVDQLTATMYSIPNITRTITINTIRTLTDVHRVIDSMGNVFGGSPYMQSASAFGQRYGGIVEASLAQGGIVQAALGTIVRSPTVLFGERGTGQEAYIPQRGIPRNRALDLLNTAAGWYGAAVAPGVPTHPSAYSGNAATGGMGTELAAQLTGARVRFDLGHGQTLIGVMDGRITLADKAAARDADIRSRSR
jgi:hypothetical protein